MEREAPIIKKEGGRRLSGEEARRRRENYLGTTLRKLGISKSSSAWHSASIGEGIFQNGQVHLDIGGREVGGRLHFFFDKFEKCIFFVFLNSAA